MDEQDGTKPPLERIEKVTHVDGAELVCTILYYSTTAIETSIEQLQEEVDKVRQKGNGSTSDECQEDDQEQAQEEQASKRTTPHERQLAGLRNSVLGVIGDRGLPLQKLYSILAESCSEWVPQV